MPDVSAFLIKTFELLSDAQYASVIRWSDDGFSFQVTDPVNFAKYCLPTKFKHDKFTSFVRQLNYYGFLKIGDPNSWAFQHECFIRGRPDLLRHIRRKTADPVRKAEKHAQLSQTEELEKLQQEVLILRNQNQNLWNELQASRQMYEKLQTTLLGLLKDKEEAIMAADSTGTLRQLQQIQQQQQQHQLGMMGAPVGTSADASRKQNIMDLLGALASLPQGSGNNSAALKQEPRYSMQQQSQHLTSGVPGSYQGNFNAMSGANNANAAGNVGLGMGMGLGGSMAQHVQKKQKLIDDGVAEFESSRLAALSALSMGLNRSSLLAGQQFAQGNNFPVGPGAAAAAGTGGALGQFSGLSQHQQQHQLFNPTAVGMRGGGAYGGFQSPHQQHQQQQLQQLGGHQPAIAGLDASMAGGIAQGNTAVTLGSGSGLSASMFASGVPPFLGTVGHGNGSGSTGSDFPSPSLSVPSGSGVAGFEDENQNLVNEFANAADEEVDEWLKCLPNFERKGPMTPFTGLAAPSPGGPVLNPTSPSPYM